MSRRRSLGLTLLLSLPLLACSRSPPPNFYLLTPAGEARSVRYDPALAEIGLAPIQLPRYLERPQLQTELSPHRLRLHEGHQWADGLDGELQRAVAESLRNLLPRRRIVPFGPGESPELLLRLRVTHLVLNLESGITLHVEWSAAASRDHARRPVREMRIEGRRAGELRPLPSLSSASAEPAVAHRSVIHIPRRTDSESPSRVDEADALTELPALLSRAVAQLSQEIAAAIDG